MAQSAKRQTKEQALDERRKLRYHRMLSEYERMRCEKENTPIIFEIRWRPSGGMSKHRWGTLVQYDEPNKTLTFQGGTHYGPYEIPVDTIETIETYDAGSIIIAFIDSRNLGRTG